MPSILRSFVSLYRRWRFSEEPEPRASFHRPPGRRPTRGETPEEELARLREVYARAKEKFEYFQGLGLDALARHYGWMLAAIELRIKALEIGRRPAA